MLIFRSSLIFTFLFFSLGLISSPSEKAIEKRISPIGQVCVEGQDCAQNQVVLMDASIDPRTGKEIYEVSCKTCHSIGLAGAPTFGIKSTWGDRSEKGIDLLLASVINGLNGMPPMGLCMDCSEEELKSSIEYILSELK
tara:strand:- start:4 stop:420 length:417 start_codon:yes stop_codon:yes gene_type:complete